MGRLVSRQTDSLQEYCSNEGNISRNVITLSIISVGGVQKGHTWSAEDSSFVCCGSHYRDYLGEESLPYLKECYSNIFDNVDKESITGHFNRYAVCEYSGKRYGSSLTRRDRSFYILARWCALGGKIDTSGGDLKPDVIEYFYGADHQNQWAISSFPISRCALVPVPSLTALARCSSGVVVQGSL